MGWWWVSSRSGWLLELLTELINTELFLDQPVASSLKDVEGEDGDAALEEASFFRTSLCKLGRLLRES